MTVAVCVCTYRRPDVLRRLLQRLTESARDVSDVAQVGVVVVDDDRLASARSVVAEFEGSFPLGLRYEHAGSGNISVARNRALELGLDQGERLAFIDDDCMPDVDWLRQLIVAQDTYRADSVSGRCIDTLPPTAGRWLAEQPFLDEFWNAGGDGAVLSSGAMKNTLIDARFLRRTGVRFDPAFGTTGGEDSMFFAAVRAAGAHQRFAAHAVVREELTTARASFAYQLRRRLWYGNAEAFTSVLSGRSSRARAFASGLKVVADGALRPGRRLRHRQPPQWRFSLAEILRGVGRVIGATGIRLKHV